MKYTHYCDILSDHTHIYFFKAVIPLVDNLITTKAATLANLNKFGVWTSGVLKNAKNNNSILYNSFGQLYVFNFFGGLVETITIKQST